MHYYDKEKTRELTIDHPNYITESGKLWVLPHLIQSYAMVEIILVSTAQVIVEAQSVPIFYGRHCGSRIHIGGTYGNSIDLNPKFIWSREGRCWLLSTHGGALFAEVELNEKIKVNNE